jgi:hypothetical protein
MPSTKRGTTDIAMPKRKDGVTDKRYVDPQMCNKNGKRDMRCTLTDGKRKTK